MEEAFAPAAKIAGRGGAESEAIDCMEGRSVRISRVTVCPDTFVKDCRCFRRRE